MHTTIGVIGKNEQNPDDAVAASTMGMAPRKRAD
jgi:hypothetical protein